MPWLIREGHGGKHEARGDDETGRGRTRSGGTQLEDDQSEQQAQPHCPNGHLRRLHRPPVRFEHGAGGHKGHDQKEHELGLPHQLRLGHASSYRSGAERGKAIAGNTPGESVYTHLRGSFCFLFA